MTKDEAAKHLGKLIHLRDTTLAAVQSLEDEKRKVVDEVEALSQRASALALRISDLKGGQKWLDLKSEIASLYRQGIKPIKFVEDAIQDAKTSWFSRFFKRK